MANDYFQFKQFRIEQDQSGMKVTTDACIMGALVPVKDFMHILDIGTGTGLLSLMLSQKAAVEIQAIEIDEDAFEQAKANFNASPWNKSINIEHTRLQDFQTEVHFDLIICNPPFFSSSQRGQIHKKNKALHADHLNIDDLAKHAQKVLKPEGELWVMYPEHEMGLFEEKALAFGFQCKTELIIKNTVEGPVFRRIKSFSLKKERFQKCREFIIRSENGNYSDDFKSALGDFYLHL